MAGVWNRNLQGCQRAAAIGFAEPGYATIYLPDGTQLTSTKASGTNSVVGFSWTNLSALYCRCPATTTESLYATRNALLLLFGNGSVTPAADDVALTSVVRPTVSNTTNGAYSYVNGVANRTINVTVQNPNAADMTIREWGLYAGAGSFSTSNSQFSEMCLIYHALLDTPVTLHQYESATFTLTLQLTVAAES